MSSKGKVSGSIFTPLRTPVDVGESSGGEWQFEHSGEGSPDVENSENSYKKTWSPGSQKMESGSGKTNFRKGE